MAVYETPIREERYVERDTSGSSAGVWAAVIVLVALLAVLLFGFRFFNRTNTDSGTNINGTINIPSNQTDGTGGGNFTPPQ